MKISCEIIRDLLPLYHDEVCSEASRALVEEHLGECPDCKKILVEMDAPVPATENTDDRAVLEHLAGTVKRKKKRAFWKGAVIAATACIALLGIYLGLDQLRFPIGGSQAQVTDVCELKNGMIAYHLSYADSVTNLKGDTVLVHTADGSFYRAHNRGLFPLYQDHVGEVGRMYGWFVIDRSEANSWQEAHGDGVRMKAYYIGTPEDHILVWEEGMDLPPASETVEAIWNFPAEYPRND